MQTKGQNIKIRINGRLRTLPCRDSKTLLELLREELHLISIKSGSEDGGTGACNVLINHRVAAASMVFAHQVNKQVVTTLEGILENPEFKLLKECLERNGATECGYALPGLIMSLWEMILFNPKPNREEILNTLDGHVLRGQSYELVVAAVEEFVSLLPRKVPVAPPDPLADAELQIDEEELPRKRGKS